MTITAEGATKALFLLDAYNLAAPKPMQARAWADLLNEKRPSATDDDLLAAVKNLAIRKTPDSRGGTFVAIGEVAAELRNVRNRAIESAGGIDAYRQQQAKAIEAPDEGAKP